MDVAVNIAFAVAGTLLIASGSVLQKVGSPWLGWKQTRDRRFYRLLLIWVGGFIVYNLAMFPSGMASKTLPPYVMSAITGLGLIETIALSALFLNEKVYRSDFLNALVVLAAVATLALSQPAREIAPASAAAVVTMTLIPYLVVLPAFFERVPTKLKTMLFATYAGSAGGLTVVLMSILVRSGDGSWAGYIRSPWLYAWIVVGLLAQAGLQLALRSGELVVIGPLQNASSIIYPAICTYFIFGYTLSLLQAACMAAIVLACANILTKRGAPPATA